MTEVTKREYNISPDDRNYRNLIRHLRLAAKHVLDQEIPIIGGIGFKIYHYAFCTITLREYDLSFPSKEEKIELKVISDTESQAKRIFNELEEILLNGEI